MSERTYAAELVMREAERLDLLDKNAKRRAQSGECPKYYRHFDWRSFMTGAVFVPWILMLVLHYAGAFK
jgi:hypothetical protein